MADTVIQVENLSKQYRLGAINHGTLRADLASWWARMRGQEDPNLRIGQISQFAESADRFWALKNVGFEVKQGEVLGIIGKNGAGKSTLLKILSRVTAPTRGQIKVKGRIASLLEVGTGFHPELTGRENIFLNGAILGMRKDEIRRKLDEIIAFAEVEKFIDTPVKRYSSGMYVRLAFAVAAHLEPEILVVDEVLAVGDAEFQKKCLGKMGEVAGHGRTVLFVSHNMGAVKRLCSRALLVSNGCVVRDGAAEDVAGQYLESAFDDLSNEGRVTWPADKAPGCEEFHLLSCAVRGMQTDRYGLATTEEDIEIELVYEQATSLAGARVVLTMLSSSGETAFASTDHDVRSVQGYPPGLYKSTCRIPARLLNRGTYHLQLRAGVPGVRALIPDTDACRFLIEGQTAHGSSFDTSWPGAVCPSLKWQVEKLTQ